MTAKFKKLAAAVLAFCMLAAFSVPVYSASVQPVRAFRVGLFFGSSEVPSANLRNADGFGRGFDFGYFDSHRNFVYIGAMTEETGITIMMDRNMVWHSDAADGFGEYREGASGSIVAGCFHIRPDAQYDTFEQARDAANQFQDAFVKYESGRFIVLIGSYISREAANSAISSRGLSGSDVDAGTQHTVTVVRTGTNRVLFEFDYGGAHHLGVMPRPGGGENPETWFRGYRYHGGFEYSRRDGSLLTVKNVVDVEDYIKGILPYEMNNTWPMEALKAQAVTARTYAMSSLNRHSANGFDLCTEVHCQVYNGRNSANDRTDRAVIDTAGMYVTHGNGLAQTFYYSSNGGASENSENVWFEARPYLRGVVDPFEADIAGLIPNYYYTANPTPRQIADRLRSRGNSVSGDITRMRIGEYTPTGNVLSVIVTDSSGRDFTVSREAVRTVLGVRSQRFSFGDAVVGSEGLFANNPAAPIGSGPGNFAINSEGEVIALPGTALHAITVTGVSVPLIAGTIVTGSSDIRPVNGVFTITGSGWGHNVGMSQWGARSMAEIHGMNYVEILTFYFTGVTIRPLD